MLLRIVLRKCVVSRIAAEQGGMQRGRRYASSQNAPRPFLLVFRLEFTENRMARWRSYSELVINPWKPPTQGCYEKSPALWLKFLFVFCIVSFWKFVCRLLFGEGILLCSIMRFKIALALTPECCWLIDRPVHRRICWRTQFHCSAERCFCFLLASYWSCQPGFMELIKQASSNCIQVTQYECWQIANSTRFGCQSGR